MAVQQTAAADAKSGIDFPVTRERGLGPGYDFTITEDYVQVYVDPEAEFGALEARLELVLPENALIDAFTLEMTARRASSTPARSAAQLRTNASRADGDLAVVVDFGTPRTVTSLAVPSRFKILQVRTWNGSSFASSVYSRDRLTATSGAVLTSEVRSERLEVEIAGTGSGTELLDGMTLVLPDLPADLELRLEGDDVLWRHAGPAQAGTADAPTVDAFNRNGRRLIDLTGAMRKRLGDPLSTGDRTLSFLLSSRAPGFLKLEDSDVRYRRIRRATLDGKDEAALVFDAEGLRALRLEAPGLPDAALISEVRLEAVATPPVERRLPPVGPPAGALARLEIDAEHAVALRLPAESGIALLSGLRLALEAGEEGAEVRFVLWDAEVLEDTSAPDLRPSRPARARDDAASDPLVLDPGASGWCSLALADPVPVEAGDIFWAVLLVSRGNVASWLGPGTGEIGRVMTGPPSGPFQKLPVLFEQGAFASERMPLRLIGEAPDDAPIAPLRLRHQAFVAVTPTARGIGVTLAGPPDPSRSLEVESLAVQTVRLRNVDIVSDA